MKNDKELEAILGLLKMKRVYKNKTLYAHRYRYKSNFQLNVLRRIYSICTYPSTQTRFDIAILLNLSSRSVQIWFQNTRQNCRHSNDEEKFYTHNRDEMGVTLEIKMLLYLYFMEVEEEKRKYR